MLKSTIVARIRDFYVVGFDKSIEKDGGWLISPKYQTRVLPKNRSPVYASLAWLKDAEAIDEQDITIFERVKACRNDLAHRINQMLTDGLPANLPDRFAEMIGLVDKIERWWIVNVELPTNPQFDDQRIEEADIAPGTIMGLRVMIDIALGSEKDSRRYINEFLHRSATAKTHQQASSHRALGSFGGEKDDEP